MLKKVCLKKCTEKTVFSAHLGAEYHIHTNTFVKNHRKTPLLPVLVEGKFFRGNDQDKTSSCITWQQRWKKNVIIFMRKVINFRHLLVFVYLDQQLTRTTLFFLQGEFSPGNDQDKTSSCTTWQQTWKKNFIIFTRKEISFRQLLLISLFVDWWTCSSFQVDGSERW